MPCIAQEALPNSSPTTSKLELEPVKNDFILFEKHEHEVLQNLTGISLTAASLKPVIAVDLDDVLSQTNEAVAECKQVIMAFQIWITFSKGITMRMVPGWICLLFTVRSLPSQQL